MSKAIFFDRDGVLNDLVLPDLSRGPRNIGELILNKHINEVFRFATHCGFEIFIITNQPDISRNYLSFSENEKIRSVFFQFLKDKDHYLECAHDNFHNCSCRKPKPGLIFAAAVEFDLDLSESIIVGDKWTDILAGKAAGLQTILLENSQSNLGTSQGNPPEGTSANFTVNNLQSVISVLELIS